jgi:hypothetical protein
MYKILQIPSYTMVTCFDWHILGSGVRVTWSLVLCVYFIDRCLSFFFWPLCCLSFFELRILITPFGIFYLFLGDCVNVNIILRNVLPFTPSVTAKKKLRYGKHYCLARKLQLHVCNSEREGAPNRGKQPIFNATDHKKHLVI